MEAGFRTLAGPCRHETERVKGSRFIGCVAPAATPDDALAFLEEVRAEHPSAGHHCFAYRLREGGAYRFSDDGEPGGSAGRPILAVLDGSGLVDLVAVVVRWFGGTKLGVGGLARAYSAAAREALERAEVREVVLTRTIVVHYPYECSRPMEGLLSSEGLAPVRTDYGAEVTLELEVPVVDVEAFLRQVVDRSSGRARVDE